MDPEVPFLTRLWLCWACWFRILFDGNFARSALELTRGKAAEQALPVRVTPVPQATPASSVEVQAERSPADGALQLLALLQREGRLIDFLQQDVTSFPDADVGAAARVVHAGCRKALLSHAKIVSVRSEDEGASVSVDGTSNGALKLTGNLSGKAPYRGVLRHRGWRVDELNLPTLVGQQDLTVVAPAEVEL
jgi:hypothetical protein